MPRVTTRVTRVSQVAAVNATQPVSSTSAGAIRTRVDVAAGIVADTMKKTDATSSPQPVKNPHFLPNTWPTQA